MARPSAGSCLKHRWSRGKKVRKSTENDEVSERMRAGSQAGRHVFYVVLVFCFAFLCKDQQARVPITSLSLRSSWYRTKLMLMWKLHSRCCCVAHDHAGFGVGERRLCFEFLLQHGPLSPENHLSLSVSLGFVLFLFSSLIDSLPARTLSLSLALSLSLFLSPCLRRVAMPCLSSLTSLIECVRWCLRKVRRWHPSFHTFSRFTSRLKLRGSSASRRRTWTAR